MREKSPQSMLQWISRTYDMSPAALARMFGKPLIHTYHTFFAEYSHYIRVKEQVGRAFVAQYSRLYCNRCQTIVVPSEYLREHFWVSTQPMTTSTPSRRCSCAASSMA